MGSRVGHIDIGTNFRVVNIGSFGNHIAHAQIATAATAVAAIERHLLVQNKRTDNNAGDTGYRQGRVDRLRGSGFDCDASRLVHNVVGVFGITQLQHFYAGGRRGAVLYSVTRIGSIALCNGDNGFFSYFRVAFVIFRDGECKRLVSSAAVGCYRSRNCGGSIRRHTTDAGS